MSVGERLRNLRHNMNMTLKDLGAELGVSLNTVYRWEHDLAAPRKEAMNKMAEIYQVPLKWLLYGITVEEGNAITQPDDTFEQNLLRICRRLSESSKYKILGYAERIWVEDMKDENLSVFK